MLGGLILYIVGFIVGDKLLALCFTGGGDTSFSELTGEANALFFCINILVKGALLWFYTRWALRHDVFRGKFAFGKRTMVIIVISLILFSMLSLFLPQLAPSLLKEWNYRSRLYGSPFGLINTALQYIYYVFEGLVMVWITDAFQTAGEVRFRKARIPWGGIALGVLWGGGHVLSKGWFTALTWALPFGVVVGVCYLLDKKGVWSPFLVWMIYNIV